MGIDYGKVPTFDNDTEQIVLAGLMCDSRTIMENHIRSEWFYKDEHQTIASVLLDLKSKGIPIDTYQTVFHLKKSGLLDQIGGPVYITQISNRVASSANIKSHIRNLYDLFTRRELAQKATRIYNDSFDMSIDVDDLVHQMQSDTLDLLDFNAANVITFESSVKSVIERARLNQHGNHMSGIPTGLTKIDRRTGGLQKGDLTIIAGDTSQGKTALAITILKNCMKSGYKAACYSLEMTSDQLTARIMAQETSIPSNKILNSKLNSFDLTCVENFPQNGLKGLYYDERSTNSIENICASIRRFKVKYDISLAVVDFIQIVNGGTAKAEEARLAEITRKLKNIAKELSISVIALSQLSRAENKHAKPDITRLRGSGQIGESADFVFLLYRPEEYGNSYSYDEPFVNYPTEGTAQIIIAKGRNVGTGNVLVKFDSERTCFYDYETPKENAPSPDERIEPKKELPY